jgi:hypothetical protein
VTGLPHSARRSADWGHRGKLSLRCSAPPLNVVTSMNVILNRRELLRAGAGTAFLSLPEQLAASGIVATPEQFGARGDGRSNDTEAFAAMADFVSRGGGGEVALRPTTYVVGRQIPRGREGYAFAPGPIMEFKHCVGRLTIHGNGARLRCADGLRFGTFDPVTGRPTKHPQPHYGSGELASPYFAMLSIEDCSGPIEIRDLELDGNLAGLQIGGPWGDTGWQIGCVGLHLHNNSGPEHVRGLRTHHHGQDGVLIDGPSERSNASVLEDVVSHYNVRQGCSIVGGRNYSFVECRFNHTGKAGLMSAPGAGVDIEAEGGKTVRNLRFTGCRFSNNAGVGMVADQGDSQGALFERCRFIGTTSWGVWPNKPRFHFMACDFVGSIVNPLGNADPAQATQFLDCRFRDDPALSPTGEVYNSKDEHPIADVPFGANVRFSRCRFELTHRAVLPWSAGGVVYADCVMSQVERKTAYPRGTYLGRNRITGPVDLYSSRILGDLIVNGRVVPRTG